jgi:hypothetical protein
MMLRGPITRTLFRLTLPVIAVNVAQTFVAILEAYWVSRLGAEAVAGVSPVLPLLIPMNTMSNGGIGGGVSSAIARAVGADRQDDADALLLHTLMIALAFGVAFSILAILFGPQLYASLGGGGNARGRRSEASGYRKPDGSCDPHPPLAAADIWARTLSTLRSRWRGRRDIAANASRLPDEYSRCPLSSPSVVRDVERTDQNRDRCTTTRVPSRCNSSRSAYQWSSESLSRGS